MIEPNDWRITNQMHYLYKKPLLNIPYRLYQAGWDHDHCSFCLETIDMSSAEPAYCTTDEYNWICPECFEDFKDMFEWEVVPDEQDDNAAFAAHTHALALETV
jgi:hypothetical protein